MPNPGTPTQLKGVTDIGRPLLTEMLESNISQFFQWGLLNVGNFFQVRIPTSGAYGGDFSRLRLGDDPNFPAGQVWEGVRKDWVWESGLNYAVQPIQISGVYVNGSYYPL